MKLCHFNMSPQIIPIGRESRKRVQSQNIDLLSSEYDLDEQQLNLLRSSGMYSYKDLTQYLNGLLSKQYATEDERKYNEGLRDEQREYDEQAASRMRAQGLNPDLTGIPDAGSPIQGSGSIYPENSLTKALSGGSLSESFNSVLGNVLKLATFGVSAFGTIQSTLMESGLKVAGLALSDLPSFDRDDKGFADVDSAIAAGLASRGFRPNSRKAAIYAGTVRRHINSLPEILKSVQSQDSYNKALLSSKVSAFEASDEYTASVIHGLELAQDTKVKLAEYDAEIAKQKAEFIKNHPDYTSDSLEAALQKMKADTRQAEANATKSELEVQGTRLDNTRKQTENKIADENLKQEQAKTATDESDKDLRILKNNIEQIRIDGFDEMIRFCRQYEEDSYNAGIKHSPEYNAWAKANEKRTRQYVEFRKRLRKAGYFKDQRLRLKGGVNAGPVSVGVGN